ncbi:hypothetical protein SSX86_022474 [Deinandra increscens subsp. villosa]|uniref:C2H2-type domain-containing protein n=1 Tax=Deinandra increscens subsp. villosa TaxID=3103831 RepID=A0AAP0CQP9_9ASTR
MTIKRSFEDGKEVENLAMENCLMLLSRVGQSSSLPKSVFNCKTCNKKFTSPQALGGHCASHKRPRTTDWSNIQMPPNQAKTHECPVCGLEFTIGQALGGHMKRHRYEKSFQRIMARWEPLEEKRGLCMDLNLTPYENDMKEWRSSVNTALATQGRPFMEKKHKLIASYDYHH